MTAEITSCLSARSKEYSAQEKFEGNCFKCGKQGHRRSDCWVKLGKTDKWCNVCKSKSHDTKECRRNTGKREHAKKAEIQKEEIQEDEENNEHSFAFTLTGKTSEQLGKNNDVVYRSLLVDTGATSHIINDKSKFVTFDEDFDPSYHAIELADGRKRM